MTVLEQEISEITERANGDPELVLQDALFWDYITDEFDPLTVTREEKGVMIDVLMLKRAEAFKIEATNFASLYYADRAIRKDEGNQKTTEFFTRDTKSQAIDSVTKIIETDDDFVVIQHEMVAPNTFGFDQSVGIIATSDGMLTIYVNEYKNGLTTRRDVTDEKLGDEIMREYFESSITAGAKVKKRTPEERMLADEDARNRRKRNPNSTPGLYF